MLCLLLSAGGGGSSSSSESSEKCSSSDCVLKSVEFLVEKSEFLVENISEYLSSEQRSEVWAEKRSLESACGRLNETKSRLRMEKGSDVGTLTWSLELALATAIEKSEWKRSFEVELAREKSELSQLARIEKRSTLTEEERGIEPRDSASLAAREKRPSLESELLRRRRAEPPPLLVLLLALPLPLFRRRLPPQVLWLPEAPLREWCWWWLFISRRSSTLLD